MAKFAFFSLTVLSAVALLASCPNTVDAKKGQIAAVESADNFCFFLPPQDSNRNISDNEDKAIAFCTKKLDNAPGAQLFPEGFIQSAHFKRDTEKDWVQVTGKMVPKNYALNKKDGGGQYDVKAPVGAMCAGYKYFVNMVEPDGSIYCMRCCATKEDCPVGKSTYGCKSVIGGTY
ncbi:hypothetical protein CPC16_002573 [Podila verticillata]|nr:hypothetical protein CPC16_002573 [Podila verticillata]KAI9232302.1 MAG: hypothetical protein BYD32DRAFT_441076 [Podila humilis]